MFQFHNDSYLDSAPPFFGVNMGVYYGPQQPAIVPDGFLSLGVPRRKSHRGRLSYLIWQEQVVPQLVMEFVSQTLVTFKRGDRIGVVPRLWESWHLRTCGANTSTTNFKPLTDLITDDEHSAFIKRLRDVGLNQQ